jgi:predicted transcriptional regulator
MAEGVFTVRIPPEKQRQLDALAQVLDRSRNWVVCDAINQYLDVQAWQIAQIRHGVEEADRGELVSHEEVSTEALAKIHKARDGQ